MELNTNTEVADIVQVSFRLGDDGNNHVTVRTEHTYLLSLTEGQAKQLLKLMDSDFGHLRGTVLGVVHAELSRLCKRS